MSSPLISPHPHFLNCIIEDGRFSGVDGVRPFIPKDILGGRVTGTVLKDGLADCGDLGEGCLVRKDPRHNRGERRKRSGL